MFLVFIRMTTPGREIPIVIRLLAYGLTLDISFVTSLLAFKQEMETASKLVKEIPIKESVRP